MEHLLKITSEEMLGPTLESDMPNSLSSLSNKTNESQAFRFFDLPFELRSKILKFILVTDEVYCLHPQNFRAGFHRLNLFLASRRMHEDAYRVFYGSNTFRMFPTHGRFFGNKTVPLIARLPPRYKDVLVSLELRLGIGWTAPPKSWAANDRLGLEQMSNVRVVKIVVECDPSLEVFRGFRVSKKFYSEFARQLLQGILQRLPAVSTIEFDTWPSVPSHGHLMTTLLDVASKAGMKIVLAVGMELDPHWDENCRASSRVLTCMAAETTFK